MRKIPVLLQLYSVREDLAADWSGTLEKTREMGYEGVEFSGYSPGMDGERIRRRLDELGLDCMSGHVPFASMVDDLDFQIAFHRELGCRYMAIPWLAADSLPGGKDFGECAGRIRSIGEELKKSGMTLLYHNHEHEFDRVGGEYILDILYETIPADLLQTQLDTCWIRVGGADPAAYVRKYAGRAPVLHLKDFTSPRRSLMGRPGDIPAEGKDGSNPKDRRGEGFDFRPVGHGLQDMPSILEAAQDAGVQWLAVEQDRSTGRPAMEAARMSREYLKTLGY